MKLDKFTQAYIECAIWASTDEDGKPLDANYTADDLSAETLEAIKADCADFQEANDLSELNPEQAGHDFWLTRNRHGAGFWDRGLGELGNRLTQAAHVYGSFDLYVGDDDKLYGA